MAAEKVKNMQMPRPKGMVKPPMAKVEVQKLPPNKVKAVEKGKVSLGDKMTLPVGLSNDSRSRE
jgi:hypothetical protein